jgi:hypothetical protein
MSDLIIQQGTDSGYAWPILTSDGEPFDLTGYTVRAQIRTRAGAKLHEFSTLLGNAIIAGNQVILTWTSTATAAWRWNGGVYDLEIVSPLGSVRRIDHGWVTVAEEVTK